MRLQLLKQLLFGNLFYEAYRIYRACYTVTAGAHNFTRDPLPELKHATYDFSVTLPDPSGSASALRTAATSSSTKASAAAEPV